MEYKLCECGCNEQIPIRNKHGDLARFKHGHFWRNRKREHMTGKNHHNWKGGRRPDGKGYILLYMPQHPRANKQGYIREHIYVLEQKLGRYLKKGEIPHHLNGKKDDNRPENLTILITHKEHMVIHNTGNQYNKKDMSDRSCIICKSNITGVDEKGYVKWRGIGNNKWICKKCYSKTRSQILSKAWSEFIKTLDPAFIISV